MKETLPTGQIDHREYVRGTVEDLKGALGNIYWGRYFLSKNGGEEAMISKPGPDGQPMAVALDEHVVSAWKVQAFNLILELGRAGAAERAFSELATFMQSMADLDEMIGIYLETINRPRPES